MNQMVVTLSNKVIPEFKVIIKKTAFLILPYIVDIYTSKSIKLSKTDLLCHYNTIVSFIKTWKMMLD